MYTTDRLILTPMVIDDASFVLELLNTEEWINNIGQRNVHTLKDAEKYIEEKMINHYKKNGYGNYLMTTINYGCKIGCVSLYNREDTEGVDIGFALLPNYMRKGYAYEGALAVMKLAESNFKLKSVCAFTSKENKASQGLIEKLGLRYKKKILFGEEQEEMLCYELKF